MTAFFRDIIHNPFLLNGLLAGLLASLACGVIGPYVITRRIVFLAGAIAHVSLGGIGAAIFLAWKFPNHFAWLSPPYGAAIAAILAAVIIGLVYERIGERMDTLIGALWAVGMSLGILLIKFTPGYYTELMSFLFGNISIVHRGDLWLILALDVVILLSVLMMHKRLLAICLDQEQAELQGINILMTNIILLTLVSLTVICLIQVVGLILVLALLTLPAATAGHHISRMAPLMLVAVILSAVLTTLPRIGVYGTRVSPESAIVLAAAAVYLVSVIIHRLRVITH